MAGVLKKFNCEICGEEIIRGCAAKYCSKCAYAVRTVRGRAAASDRHHRRQAEWNSLSEEEKLKRINMASKMILYGR